MSGVTYKSSRTIKNWRVKFMGWHFVIPKGTVVHNKTACGNDDNYYHIASARPMGIISMEDWWSGNELPLTLVWDMEYHLPSVPKEYCKPYESEEVL